MVVRRKHYHGGPTLCLLNLLCHPTMCMSMLLYPSLIAWGVGLQIALQRLPFGHTTRALSVPAVASHAHRFFALCLCAPCACLIYLGFDRASSFALFFAAHACG